MTEAGTLPAASVESLLSWRLVVAGRLLRTTADGVVAEHTPGAQAYGVLLRLAEEDGLSQAELARRQRVEAPTMCRLVDRLVRDGLVHRDRHPADRRVVRVLLTETGRRTLRDSDGAVEEIERRAFSGLDDDDRRMLADLLGRVVETLSHPHGVPA
jgi:DNA-binding MarR family transcriptional regulator